MIIIWSDRSVSALVLIILQSVNVANPFHTLNLHIVVCQLLLNKKLKKSFKHAALMPRIREDLAIIVCEGIRMQRGRQRTRTLMAWEEGQGKEASRVSCLGVGGGFTEADWLSSFPWFLRKPQSESAEGPGLEAWAQGSPSPHLAGYLGATWKKEKFHRSWLIVFPRTRN